MFSVTITDQTGQRTVKAFDKADVSIGRERSNDIVLLRGNVSKKHARILYNRGAFMVVDNKSTNGTFVNGERIESPYVLQPADKVFIGDFVLEISEGQGGAEKAAVSAKARRAPPPEEDDPPAETDKTRGPRVQKSPVAVNWDDDEWSNPVEVGQVDEAGGEAEPGEHDADLDFVAPGMDPQDAEAESSYGSMPLGPTTNAPFHASADYDQSVAAGVADCLREYVDLDAHYHVHALGGDCDCGACLLCRARDALARLGDG